MKSLATLLALILGFLPGLAAGQTISVNSGEHPGFTRIVLRVPPGIAWTLTETEDGHAFLPSVATDFDLSRVFDRIPRRRLASTRLDAGRLVFSLACDCPVRAWEERPGLVVIDIMDARSDPPERARGETVESPDRPPPAPTDGLIARRVGRALARGLRESAPVPETGPGGLHAAALEGLPADLGAHFAQALSQGLLAPSADTAIPGVVLRPAEILGALPQNARIVDVTRRPDLEQPPANRPDPACQDAGVLEFLAVPMDINFSQGLSGLGHDLYGEFDQPSDEAFLRLVQHYLAAGFGAESRALINYFSAPVPGRDLLAGLSDLFEGRMSNSRMRLAEAVDCGGVAALFAALAHPANRIADESAASIALTFVSLPPPLRAVVGPDLVNELLEARAVDSARVVLDSLRNSGWAMQDALALAEALLEDSRGDADRASHHLEPIVLRQVAGTLTWLELALREQTPIAEATLDDAESLAAQHRGTDDALHLMSAVIRLHAQSPRPENAIGALDRLESWEAARRRSDETLATLRDEVWHALAQRAEDRSLISLSLARSDWLDPAIRLETRQALAGRFIDLGFARAADRLVSIEPDALSLRLRARAALLRGEPEMVHDLLAGDATRDAEQLRATAAGQSGDHGLAMELLDSSLEFDAAARSAVLQGNWRRLEDLRERGASVPSLDAAAGRFLGLAPGVAGILQELPDPGQGSMTVDQPLSPQQAIEEPPGPAAAGTDAVVRHAPTAASPTDAGEILESLGMVSRAAVLLAESARLRQAIGTTLQVQTTP